MENDYKESIIASYLMNYLPVGVGKEDDNTIYKTTREIQDELDDIVTLNLNEISQMLHNLGYNLALREDNRPAWAMEDIR